MTDYTMTRVTLRDHLTEETLGERSPIQVDPTLKAQQEIEEAWFLKIQRMTALRFARLDPVEKRNYARRARQLAKVFAEKADMMTRNAGVEPELPEALRQRAAL